jgi:bacillithiol system protein YtxJ
VEEGTLSDGRVTSRGVRGATAARRPTAGHQTPQVILLRGGKAVWDASHWDISEEALREALERQAG